MCWEWDSVTMTVVHCVKKSEVVLLGITSKTFIIKGIVWQKNNIDVNVYPKLINPGMFGVHIWLL